MAHDRNVNFERLTFSVVHSRNPIRLACPYFPVRLIETIETNREDIVQMIR